MSPWLLISGVLTKRATITFLRDYYQVTFLVKARLRSLFTLLRHRKRGQKGTGAPSICPGGEWRDGMLVDGQSLTLSFFLSICLCWNDFSTEQADCTLLLKDSNLITRQRLLAPSFFLKSLPIFDRRNDAARLRRTGDVCRAFRTYPTCLLLPWVDGRGDGEDG